MTWKLNDSNFTFADKLRIAAFILGNNRWTQGEYVKLLEHNWSDLIGKTYPVFVSSGSTANLMIASYVRHITKDIKKKYVILPSVTWTTSVSPWIMLGFEPIFVDVTLEDFSINEKIVTNIIENKKDEIAAVFPTSLLGLKNDFYEIEKVCKENDIYYALDHCENTLGTDLKHLNKTTCSTSFYFGHQLTSVEGGMIFTQSEEEYKYFLMCRNHGMIRSLKEYGFRSDNQNKLVHPSFDFNILGNNYRNTNINAFIGLLDLRRIKSYSDFRKSKYWQSYVIKSKYYIPTTTNAPFCFPIVPKKKCIKKLTEEKTQIVDYCKLNNIEYRPIVGGNLLRQKCFNKYQSYFDFPNAEYLNNYGIYVGLHNKVKEKDFINLINFLGNL